MIQNYKLYERAKERLEAECDIVEIMNQVRRSKNFQRNFLSRRQKILLRFDSSNVIHRINDSNAESEEEKLDIDDQIVNHLDSKNNLVVLFTAAKILKIIMPYIEERQLSSFDTNLFYSFFLKNYTEEE